MADRSRHETHAPGSPRWSTATSRRGWVAEVVERLGRDLPDGPTDPAEVVDLLAEACEPGLAAIPSGRFFGFVMGGTHPAAAAADWLTTAWDQNAGLRSVTPAATAVEDLAEAWTLDLLGLPPTSVIGLVTGGTMANFTGLAAGRDALLARAGWDVGARGLVGSPGVRVLVGEERHDSVDLVLRYLGLGAPETVPADGQGRLDAAALAESLAPRRVRAADHRGAPGRQHPLRRVRPLRSGHRGRPRARRLGARRRRVRAVRRRLPGVPPPRLPATRRPTRGRPTPTRRSTSPTTAGWPSSATRRRCARRCRCTERPTWCGTPPVTRSSGCPS